MAEIDRLLRREQKASVAINVALSLAFFLLVFGTRARFLRFGEPDNLAWDFLPQGGMIALMAALVPALLVRRALAKGGEVPGIGTVLRQVAATVVLGLASAGVLAAACLLGPLAGAGWTAALLCKMLYGGILGLAVTTTALRRLYLGAMGEPTK